MSRSELKPKPSASVKAWLDTHAVIERDRITYPARDDLIPADVSRWIKAWKHGAPLNT